MRFLADESLDFAAVRALRAAGHDVLAVQEIIRGASDREVIALAAEDKRVLLTEDKDFGWLVFVSVENSAGVVLVRWPTSARSRLGQDVVRLVEQHGHSLAGTFVVLEPGQVRLSRRPRRTT
jgi:predicted nuclease of predicted toxin-antitoxin system